LCNEDVSFKWKKVKPNTSQSRNPAPSSTDATFDYGKVLLPLNSESTPYEIFVQVTNFNKFIQDIVIPQTKLYTQQKGHIFQIDEEELKAFFGMTIVMGYHVLPCIRDYWSSELDLRVPYIANVMTLKRFEEIRAYLHFNDNDLAKPNSDEEHDRAFKVRPVMEHFNSSFIAALSSTQFQSIDEHMIKFKGHNILRQYVKGKPIKWGFKMWCRCDSKSGYLFEFDLYTGKKRNQVEYGLGEGVVLQLTQAIKNLRCKIFIDNFFNSPLLQLKLLQMNIFSAGTVRSNRKHLPKAPQFKIPLDKEMKKGNVVAYEANGINLIKWMDNKAVFMLSNFVSAFPLQNILRRKQGSSQKENVACPTVVKQYNEHMGGVDLMHQKKNTYEFDHRSKCKYYLRVVHDLIDIGINNAYVVYTKLMEDGEDQTDSKTFRRLVARSLIGNFSSRKRSHPSTPIETAKKLRLVSKQPVQHTMEKSTKGQRCKLCTRGKLTNLTNNKCIKCNVHLCYLNNHNCFQTYHESM